MHIAVPNAFATSILIFASLSFMIFMDVFDNYGIWEFDIDNLFAYESS